MQTQVGDWLIGGPIAEGGMGIVYEASHQRTPGHFAVKEIRPELTMDAKARAYFIREANNAVRLQHPNIVRTYEKVELNNRVLLVMERLYGDTIETLLRQQRVWDAAAAAPLIRQVALGLGHAHDQSIVHRDVKPSNVFIERDGTVKVVDFGICRIVGEASLQSSRSGPPGTPAYMPPELLMGGQATPASDVFSLGLMYFRMVTGRLPHDVPEDASPWAIIAALVKAYGRDLPRMSAFRPDVPRSLELVVAQMLSVDPLQRPRDGAQVAAQLESMDAAAGAPSAGTALGVRGVRAHADQAAVRPPPPWEGPVPPASRALGDPQSQPPSPASTRLGVAGVQTHRSGRMPEPGRARFDAYAPQSPGKVARAPSRPGPAYRQTGSEPEAPAGEARRQILTWGLLAAVVVMGLIIASFLRAGLRVGRDEVSRVPATEGWIEVKSEPSGAAVEVEFAGATRRGVTPKTFTGLSTVRGVEPATVWVRMRGYQDRKFVVPVVPGLEQRIRAELAPSAGR